MFSVSKALINFGPLIWKQQIRTTFVLRRKNAPRLSKMGHKPRGLKAREYIYELIEDKNMKPHPNLNLILTKYVDGLGRKGDEVNVKPEYGYKNLILTGLAEYASDEARSRLQAGQQETIPEYSSPQVPRMINILSRKVITITMNKDEPWTLEPWHIRASLRKAGIHVMNDSQITLPKTKITGPDMNLEDKDFLVYVTINNREKAPCRCRIHHWSTQIADRLPWKDCPWTKSVEAIFDEDVDELSKLRLPVVREQDDSLLLKKR